MKKYLLPIVFVLLFPFPVMAETELFDVYIKVVKQSENYIYYAWRAEISTDESKSCYLKISFHDSDGFEIGSMGEFINIRYEKNTYTGSSMCEKNIWKKIYEKEVTLKCLE